MIEWGGEYGFDVSTKENYYVWNMNVGFVVIAPQEDGSIIEDTMKDYGIGVTKLGYVEEGSRKVFVKALEDEDGEPITYTP